MGARNTELHCRESRSHGGIDVAHYDYAVGLSLGERAI